MQKGFFNFIILVGVVIVFLLILIVFFYYRRDMQGHPVAPAVKEMVPTSTPKSPDPGIIFKSKEYQYIVNVPPNTQITEKDESIDASQIYNKTTAYFSIDGGVLKISGVCGHGGRAIKEEVITLAGQTTSIFYESSQSAIINAIQRPNSSESLCISYMLPPDENQQKVDLLFKKILLTLRF